MKSVVAITQAWLQTTDRGGNHGYTPEAQGSDPDFE